MKAFAFDVFGTLYNVDSLVTAAEGVDSKPSEFISLWRAKQLQYSFLCSLMGRFEPFWDITRRALYYTAEKRRINLHPKDSEELMAAWLHLEPFPEVEETLKKLKAKRELAVLTNGDRAFVDRLLINTGLYSYFRDVISAEEVQTYKPAPAVYQLAAHHLKLPLEEILMVSSNPFDVIGSKSTGMRVCWINRTGEILDNLGSKPDFEFQNMKPLLALG